MIDVQQWIWKLDSTGTVCFNVENKVVVKIKREGMAIKGKIQDLSMDLFWKIATLMNGPTVVQQIVFAAENEYRKNISELKKYDLNY